MLFAFLCRGWAEGQCSGHVAALSETGHGVASRRWGVARRKDKFSTFILSFALKVLISVRWVLCGCSSVLTQSVNRTLAASILLVC